MAKYLIDRAIAKRGSDSGTSSLRDRLHIRTRELAVIAGRTEFEVTQQDYEQAKRDVTGEIDTKRQNALLEPKLLPGRGTNSPKTSDRLTTRTNKKS